MPTELTLLSDRAPSSQDCEAEGLRLFADGTLLEHVSGVRQFVDGTGRAVLSIFGSRPIHARTHADRLIDGGTGTAQWWTDLTIPYGDAADGVRLARAIAATCGGRIAERM